jgi:alpha-beta hydrolase superfamily lysophospholipase
MGAGDAGRPLILLFHQAGSNRAEYAPIAPMLTALGFDALAIDQRSGGSLWGHANETVRHLGRSEDYGSAFHDLEGALTWAKSSGRSGPVIVWGSSYSAALVFLLAAKHLQDVKALLAFSPGEYLASPSSVRSAAAQLSIPIFVTSAKGAGKWRRGRRFWTQLRRGKRFNSCHTSPASTAHRPCGLIEIRKAPPRIGPPLKLFWPRSRFEGNGGAD